MPPAPNTDAYQTRQYTRRRGRRGKRALTKPQAKEVAKIAKSVTMGTIPRKHEIISVSPTAIPNVGTFTSLVNVQRGDTENERDGDRITPSYFGMRCVVSANTSQANSYVNYRVIVFQWSGDPGAITPQAGDLLENPSNPFSYYNGDFVGKPKSNKQYKILFDRRGIAETAATSPEHVSMFEIHVDQKKMLKMQFDDALATPSNGNLYLFYMSDVVANQPLIGYNRILRFTSG